MTTLTTTGSDSGSAAGDTLTRDALAVLQPGFDGTTAPDWVRRRLGEGLASVALFGRNVVTEDQVADLTAQLRAERDDLLVAIDEESGDVTRLDVRTGSSFPGNHALGAVDDPDLTRAVSRELGRRLAACGVNFDWAPSADVNANPDNPVIGVRSFGASTGLVARHTAAWVEGLQSTGVAACTKHFPGHGDTNVDSHHAVPRIDVDADTLYERELPPFRAAIAAGTRAIMSAHILVPALDPDRPGTLSRRILTGLLREELGYQGLIVTDGMEMRAISGTYGLEHGVVLAIAAGADAICVGGGLCDEGTVLKLRDALVAAVRSGELPEERLADAAARVRALAAWTARARGRADTAPQPEIGLVAARRALRVTRAGAAAPLDAPVFVAQFEPERNIAVGDQTPWGVAAELERLLPGTESAAFSGEGAGEAALAALKGRRIVAVVRDEHRHPWMGAALDTLLAARPDTVVVEMGLPQAAPRGALHLATYGAARVCGVAAAEAVVAG
ncbi:glycoside hydrolase family 3 protein [Streptomyces alanosinicus]|uniref:Sugar hydrolase n=1 Tax=Streptomyces alanosinicus TaxID=68171 RepID=A0A918YFV7_9ACTN|nr:glycoside hydrolase family 3 N-terminal domain-containing protein [Streptomyces alanosinicus]GHE01555.1 sugar hydrolase [Streptomyces alanosinicus]